MVLRLLGVPSLAAVLGIGGLGLTEDGALVDPWRQDAAPTDSSWVSDPSPPRSPAPVVAPLSTVAPKVEPLLGDSLVDPWVEVAPRAAPPSRIQRLNSAATRAVAGGWASPIVEIVNPWPEPSFAVPTDPLIVDPWARVESRGRPSSQVSQ